MHYQKEYSQVIDKFLLSKFQIVVNSDDLLYYVLTNILFSYYIYRLVAIHFTGKQFCFLLLDLVFNVIVPVDVVAGPIHLLVGRRPVQENFSAQEISFYTAYAAA